MALWQRGVNPATFSPAFRSDELRARIAGENVPILLYVGRLGREKNLRYLIQAMQLLARRGGGGAGARFKLVIVGQGPMRRTLVANLPDAHFTGPLEGAELSRWYASADVFVFPSIAETFGNVVLEAFASGLPVVGIDAGSVRELVIPHSNGRLAPVDSPAAFADHVHSLQPRIDHLRRWHTGRDTVRPVKVTPAAAGGFSLVHTRRKGAARARNHHRAHVVAPRLLEGFPERLVHRGVERVENVRAIQGNRQDRSCPSRLDLGHYHQPRAFR